MAVVADADESQVEVRRIAGNRLQLVGRSASGLLEVGQLAVHAVDARRRHARGHEQQASMRAPKFESGWSGGTARSSIQKISMCVQSTASAASDGKNAGRPIRPAAPR